MRDLKADLELCNRATMGPWKFHEVEFQCGRDECPYEKKREDNSCLKCDGVEIYQSAFVPEVLTLGCGEYDGMNDADAEFIAQSREGWPHAIERALKAEKQLEELLAWEKPKEKCYLSAMRRIAELESLVRELLEVMMSVAYQECGYEENGITKFDSMAIGARMELLLTLIEHGRLEEINSFGRRVIAKLPGAKEVLGNETT